MRQAREVVFQCYGQPLETVQSFKYLGRLLTSTNDDWPTIYKNLTKARRRWAMLAKVLAREGADQSTMARFYIAIVQAVLLYGSETWTVNQSILRVVGGFHNRVARRIAHCTSHLSNGEWVYPPLSDAFEATGLAPVETYIQERQARFDKRSVLYLNSTNTIAEER